MLNNRCISDSCIVALQLGPGRQWYLQVMYVITSADDTVRYKRASMLPVNSLKYRNGTNMKHVELKSSDFTSPGYGTLASPFSSMTTIIGICVAAVVLLFVAATVTACVVAKKRRDSRAGYHRPGYPMQTRGYNTGTARVRSAPKGYQLARGTEV